MRGLTVNSSLDYFSDGHFALETFTEGEAEKWLSEGLVRWSALDPLFFCEAIEQKLGITIQKEEGILPLNSGDQCMVVGIKGLPDESQAPFTVEQIDSATFTFRLLRIK